MGKKANKTSFKPGQKRPKGAGIKKGEKQKKTLLWEQFVIMSLDGGLQKFQRELMKLKGQPFVKNYINLLEFFKPKLNRTDIVSDGKQIFTITGVRTSVRTESKAGSGSDKAN